MDRGAAPDDPDDLDFKEPRRKIPLKVLEAAPLLRYRWRWRRCTKCDREFNTIEISLEDLARILEGMAVVEMARYLDLPEEER